MLSAMEPPPADLLPRPIIDGASGALDADAKPPHSPGAEAAEGTGAKSISGSGADSGSNSSLESGADANKTAIVDVKSDPVPDSNAPAATDCSTAVTNSSATAPSSAVTNSSSTISSISVTNSSPTALPSAETNSSTATNFNGEAGDGAERPLVVPDSDTSGEAAPATALDTSGRSELEETLEEVELRLSGSEGSEPRPEDEDLLLRDDAEPAPSPPGSGLVGPSASSPCRAPDDAPPQPSSPSPSPSRPSSPANPSSPTNPPSPSKPSSPNSSSSPNNPSSPPKPSSNTDPSSLSKPSSPTINPSSPSKPSSPTTNPSSPSKPSSPTTNPSSPSKPSSPITNPSSPSKPSSPSCPAYSSDPAATEEEAQTSADPVDLPDDMFESAAALNAAEEEEERERREANQRQRRQAALEAAADSLDSLGDSMDVDDAPPPPPPDAGDDITMDVPEVEPGDPASPTGEPAPPSDPENSAASSALGGEADDDPDDPDDPGELVELAADGDEPGELGDPGDLEGPVEDADDPGDVAAESGGLEDLTTDADDPAADPDDPAADPGDPDDLGDPDDPGDPEECATDADATPASSRKRPGSPPMDSENSKVRRLEPGRPFIAVKKVQLSENNLRILQESEERDRRRLEETAGSSAAPATPAAPAAPAAVNGVKSSLLQRVKALNRQELETLVLEKMCEAIASRSVIGDMKKSAEKHVIAAERFQKKITYLQKQVGDLHLVVRKLSAEMKTRRSPSYPVKITRTVGLQVTLAKSVPPLSSRPRQVGSTGTGTPSGIPGGTPTGTPSGTHTGTPGGTPATNGVLRAHLSSPNRPRQQFMKATIPQGQVLRTAQLTSFGNRRGRPPGGNRNRLLPSPSAPGTAVALLPVVRTVLPLGSVPVSGLSSPQRPVATTAASAASAAAAAATGVPGSPSSALKTAAGTQKQTSFSGTAPRGRAARGRPPRHHPAGLPTPPAPGSGSGSGSADVVDLTDDDDPKRPAAGRGVATVSPRRPGTVTSVTPVSRPGGAGVGRTNHPAPFPVTPPNPAVHTGQLLPPPPLLKVTRRANGIVLSWNMDLTSRHASVVSYHLFAYQESGPVSLRANPWKKVGDVRALPLPMACTLTQFQEGHKYHFAVRAEDSFRRRGPFSNPSSIALLGSS